MKDTVYKVYCSIHAVAGVLLLCTSLTGVSTNVGFPSVVGVPALDGALAVAGVP
jgi:hypothetical protein